MGVPTLISHEGTTTAEGHQMDVELERIAGEIVDAAVKLHIRAGPGLLESVYERLLGNDLEARGLVVERQKWISAEMDGVRFERAFRVDLLVNRLIVVE